MIVDTIAVTLTHKMPLLMHADNIEFADLMEEWKAKPENKAHSKPGDDRTPTWRWIGCLNYDDPNTGVVTIPSEYIMRCVMAGAAEVPMSKGKKTYKSLSQSGLLCTDFHWPLLIKGKPVKMKDINALKDTKTYKTFRDQMAAAQDLGFSLFVKRAKVGMSKHIRVRPRFDEWSTTGELLITDEQITRPVLTSILEIAGRLKGLGDWRPGGPTPGPFGTFEAKIQ